MKDKKIEVVLEMKNGQYVASVRESGETTEKFRRKVDDAAKGAAGAFQKIYNAAKAYIGFKIAQFFVNLAGKFDDVSTSFKELTSTLAGGSEGLLKSIQTAAKGTVSQLDIMKSSNLAITLMGEEVAEYLPRMMEIAKATAKSQGVTVAQMYDDIIVASGRQSVMILDNLGISSVTAGKFMEEYARKLGKTRLTLDETEKRAAFFYAVMKAGGEIVDKTGSDTLTFGQRIQLIKAGLEDAAVTLVKKMLPGMEALSIAFTDTNSRGESLIGTIGKWLSNLLVMFAAAIQQAKNLPAVFEQVARNIKDMATGKYGFVQVRNQFEEYWSKADPKAAIAHIKKYQKSLINAGFSKEYLQGKVDVLSAQDKYSWNQKEVKEDAPGKKRNNKAKTDTESASAEYKKQYEEARKYLESYRQIGMSQIDIINDNHEQEFMKLKELHDKKLITEEEYLSTREKINQKYQDQINNYAVEKTQSWLSFGSSAIGEIANLYNMAANNKIAKLDEEYAKQVEVINNSVLSEQDKEAKLVQLNAKYEADKKKVQLENAKAQKKIALMQAMVDVPAAVIATYRNMGGWPWGVAPAFTMGMIGAKKIQMIKDQPVALAEGGLATRAALAIIGEGKYKEAVVPYSPKVFRGLAEGIAKARSANNSNTHQAVNNNYITNVQGSVVDAQGLLQIVDNAQQGQARRAGRTIYSSQSAY